MIAKTIHAARRGFIVASGAFALIALLLVMGAPSIGRPFPGGGSATPVTGGGFVTSFTIQNTDPSNPIVPGASGYPVAFAQAFARCGTTVPCVASGSHILAQDHGNGATLNCQFDEVATRRENSDDGSWRHTSWFCLLPASSPQYTSVSGGSGLAACSTSPCTGTFTIDFYGASGANPTGSNANLLIANLCTGNAGGAYHDIKLVLTDVRNQDGTWRHATNDTLTFDTCTARSNTGRDAPRLVAQGNYKYTYIVRGPPVYSSDSTKDPLLYVQCYLDITATLSGVIGPIRHTCKVDNSWMNVAAGSSGNSGAPGPAGYTNDPQSISYRPTLYDGATDVLDWSYEDDLSIAPSALNVSGAAVSSLSWSASSFSSIGGCSSGCIHATIPTGGDYGQGYLNNSMVHVTGAAPSGFNGDYLTVSGSPGGADIYVPLATNPCSSGDPCNASVVGSLYAKQSNYGQYGEPIIRNGNWTIGTSASTVAQAFQSQLHNSGIWQWGGAYYFYTSGTAPGGLTFNNPSFGSQTTEKLYFVDPIGLSFYSGVTQGVSRTDIVALSTMPQPDSNACGASSCSTPSWVLWPYVTSQGSGTHSASWRMWHGHWNAWLTLDTTGLPNWAMSTSSSTRSTSPLLPLLQPAEQKYWGNTGVVPPLCVKGPTCNGYSIQAMTGDPTSYTSFGKLPYYVPGGRSNVIGYSGVGGRPDLGIMSEFCLEAFLLQDAMTWQRCRAFSLVGPVYPMGSVLDEATGRVPEINNGPPGSNHAGAGGQYPVGCTPGTNCDIGPPRLGTSILDFTSYNNVVPPRQDAPVSNSEYPAQWGGVLNGGRSALNDHLPGFCSGLYQIFGDREYLDMLYGCANRATYILENGPCSQFDPSSTGGSITTFVCSDDIINSIHWYGTAMVQVEQRSNAWWLRETLQGAFLGGDGNSERNYFNDILQENYYYWTTVLNQAVGGAVNLVSSPWLGGLQYGGTTGQSFMMGYWFTAAFEAWVQGRDPLARLALNQIYREISDHCTNAVGAYHCASYYYDSCVHDSSLFSSWPSGFGAALCTDGNSDWGNKVGDEQITFTSGSGTAHYNLSSEGPWYNGDLIKMLSCTGTSWGCFNIGGVDQLLPGTWYAVSNVDGTGTNFSIVCPSGHAVTATCPTPGQPFSSFTQGGSAFGGVVPAKAHALTAPTTGWATTTYADFVEMEAFGFTDLGGTYKTGVAPFLPYITSLGFIDANTQCCNGAANWDNTLTIP